ASAECRPAAGRRVFTTSGRRAPITCTAARNQPEKTRRKRNGNRSQLAITGVAGADQSGRRPLATQSVPPEWIRERRRTVQQCHRRPREVTQGYLSASEPAGPAGRGDSPLYGVFSAHAVLDRLDSFGSSERPDVGTAAGNLGSRPGPHRQRPDDDGPRS